MRMKGVYTVEAVFIMSICIWVMVALCYGGMYVHDIVVLESVTNEEAAAWLSSSGQKQEKVWLADLRKDLDNKLFLFQVRTVKVKSGWNEKKIRVHYTVPVSWNLLKKILSGNKSEIVFETVRETLVPAESMWEKEIKHG